MHDQPTEQHRWLERLIGTWTWAAEPVPGAAFHAMEGTERFRSIGGLWVQGVSVGEHGENQMTLGFDPRTGRFVGTFVGTGMAHLWVYDGALEADGTRLALDSVGPSMAGDGTLVRYRDVVEIAGPDERYLHAYTDDGKGGWTHFMSLRYRRV